MLMTGLSAMLLASLLAQAEQAPPEPGPPPPPSVEPVASGPAEPAPAEPAAPAKPAEPPALPVNTMGVLARFAYRLGSEGSSPGPAAGFSLGLSFQRRYFTFERLGLGIGGELFHDSFRQNVSNTDPSSPVLDTQRIVSQTSFAVVQTVSVDTDPVRFWLGAGGGLSVASFSTPESAYQPGSLSAVQPLVRGALGIDIAIAPRMAIGLRADYTHPLTNPTLATRDGTVSPFGDLFDAGAAFLYRF